MIRYESYAAAAAAAKAMETVIVPLYEDVYADVLANPFDARSGSPSGCGRT